MKSYSLLYVYSTSFHDSTGPWTEIMDPLAEHPLATKLTFLHKYYLDHVTMQIVIMKINFDNLNNLFTTI